MKEEQYRIRETNGLFYVQIEIIADETSPSWDDLTYKGHLPCTESKFFGQSAALAFGYVSLAVAKKRIDLFKKGTIYHKV